MWMVLLGHPPEGQLGCNSVFAHELSPSFFAEPSLFHSERTIPKPLTPNPNLQVEFDFEAPSAFVAYAHAMVIQARWRAKVQMRRLAKQKRAVQCIRRGTLRHIARKRKAELAKQIAAFKKVRVKNMIAMQAQDKEGVVGNGMAEEMMRAAEALAQAETAWREATERWTAALI